MNFKIFLELIRFDKPAGTLLLFLPCAFGIVINASSYKDYLLLIPCLIGSFVMRSAGCIINDIWDREFDSKVDRTKQRPLASGAISVETAVIIFIIFCCVGLVILLSFSLKTILFTLLSIPMFIIYPLMKRFTYFPQIFLGFTFNYGILVTSIEIKGEIPLQTFIIYCGTVFWTMGYDTIYGFMDIKFDKKIGVKSLPILIENYHPKLWIMLFYFIFLICIATSLFYKDAEFSIFAFIILIILMFQFLWQTMGLDQNNFENCLVRFKSNVIAGFLVLTILIF